MKSKIMAITVALALVLSLVFAIAGPVAAAPTTWNVTGTWIFSYGALYDLNLTQTGSALSGNAGYPAGTVPPASYQYTFSLTSGQVNGDTISWTATYASAIDSAAVGCTLNVTGTIAADGTMSGTWTDNYPSSSGSRSGLWKTTSGTATPVAPPLTGPIGVTGNWVAPTVTFNPTGSNIALGQLYSGWNPKSGYDFTGGYGSVAFAQNSDTGASCSLSVSSTGFGDSSGRMYNTNDGSYLSLPMAVELGTNTSTGNVDADAGTKWTTGTLPTGPTVGIPSDGNTYYFDIGAAQQITTLPTAGAYEMTISVAAGFTP